MKNIINKLEKCAIKYKDKVAIKYKDSQYTYSELYELVNTIYNNILEDKESIYAIYLDKTPEMIATVLALWKAGAGYIPIDRELPSERIEYILSNSKVNRLIISKNDIKKVDNGIRYIYIEELCNKVKEIGKLGIAHNKPNNNIAYIIYTSGSTGKPKGVQVTFENLSNFFIAINKRVDISNNDILLSITTISFDISILEMFLPLIYGATLIIGGKRLLIDARRLMDVINNDNITVMQATPITWEMLISSGWDNKTNIKILCGGEQLTKELAKKLLFVSKELYNLYGPTEATIWSSVERIVNEDIITIGKPLDNINYYVFDEEMQEQDEGELYIGGECVANGYINNELLTKERFIRHPQEQNEIIYKTGDIVSKIDGKYYYKGRNDFQIKQNGHRIEIEEIEKCIEANPIVRNAVVVPDHKVKALFAFVILDVSDDKFEDKIKIELEKTLPSYMIPRKIIKIRDFPMTFNKKIDRKVLLESAYHCNSIIKKEQILHRLIEKWSSILNDSNLTECAEYDKYGIDSLDMINLCIATNEEGLNITLQHLFQYKSIANILKNIEMINSERKLVDSNLCHNRKVNDVIKKYDIQNNYTIKKLTDMQSKMLQHYLFNRDSSAYYENYIYEVNAVAEDENIIATFERACSKIGEFKSLYIFNVNGENVRIESNKIDLIKHDIFNCNTKKQLKDIIDKILSNKYNINELGIKLSIIKYNGKKYFVISYHHIRLDGINYNKLIYNFLQDLDVNGKLKANINTNELMIYEKYNYGQDCFDKMLFEGLCSENGVKLSTTIQKMLLDTYNEITNERTTSYDIVVANGLQSDNHNDLYIKRIDIANGNANMREYQDILEENMFKGDNNKYEQCKILFIINTIPKELYNIYNKYNIKENHIEINNYEVNITVNITNRIQIDIIQSHGDLDLRKIITAVKQKLKNIKGD